MSVEILKTQRLCKIPGKRIVWKLNRNTLELNVDVDINKYEDTDSLFPPHELGDAKIWRSVKIAGNNSYMFYAVWDIRRIECRLNNFDEMNDKIVVYSLDD